MTQHLKQKLAAIMTGCAILLSIGNLIIVNALQAQILNIAILHLVCGIVVATETHRYTGVTEDLTARLAKHNASEVPHT